MWTLIREKGWNNKFHVTNMVLSTGDLADLLSHEGVLEACRQRKLQPCGFMGVGAYEMWRGRITDLFSELVHECPLFLGVTYEHYIAGKYYGIEMDAMKEGHPIRQVIPSWTTNPKDITRKMTYNICWEADFGVSIVQRAQERIAQAVLETVEAEVLQKKPPPALPPRDEKYKVFVVPADGMCGWHSLIAAEDLTRYKAVPRNPSGYATCRLMVKSEETRAKELCHHVCHQALKQCDPTWHDSIRRVLAEKQLCPTDLEWTCHVSRIHVRVTCCSEAPGLGMQQQARRRALFQETEWEYFELWYVGKPNNQGCYGLF